MSYHQLQPAPGAQPQQSVAPPPAVVAAPPSMLAPVTAVHHTIPQTAIAQQVGGQIQQPAHQPSASITLQPATQTIQVQTMVPHQQQLQPQQIQQQQQQQAQQQQQQQQAQQQTQQVLQAQTQQSQLSGAAQAPHHPIAEFLYQLTKMLTDDNREIIEWANGKIKVHYPERLEGEVLHKYFRHSKFASFQRQLNYFGFRKIAGKGKMSPCSYVNDAATSDIRSLLMIKRKTNGSAARKAALAQRAAAVAAVGMPGQIGLAPGMTAVAGMPAIGITGADLFNKALAAQMTPQVQAQALGAMGVHAGMYLAQQQQQALVQQTALQNAAVVQQPKPLGESLYLPGSDNALAALQGQPKTSNGSLPGLTTSQSALSNSLEQLNAQLGFQRTSALNLAAMGFAPGVSPSAASGGFAAAATAAPGIALPPGTQLIATPIVGGATAALAAQAPAPVQVAAAAPQGTTQFIVSGQPAPAPAPQSVQVVQNAAIAPTPGPGPATVAMSLPGVLPPAGAMNATAALNAASSSQTNNLFESSSNLSALIGSGNPPEQEQHSNQQKAADAKAPPSVGSSGATPAPAPTAQLANLGRLSSQNLLTRLPSSGAIFPDNLSSVSLTGLLPGLSSNRLTSVLSLSSFLSRDPSAAEFLPGASSANLASLAASANPLQTLVPLTASAAHPGLPPPAPQAGQPIPAPGPSASASVATPVPSTVTPNAASQLAAFTQPVAQQLAALVQNPAAHTTVQFAPGTAPGAQTVPGAQAAQSPANQLAALGQVAAAPAAPATAPAPTAPVPAVTAQAPVVHAAHPPSTQNHTQAPGPHAPSPPTQHVAQQHGISPLASLAALTQRVAQHPAAAIPQQGAAHSAPATFAANPLAAFAAAAHLAAPSTGATPAATAAQTQAQALAQLAAFGAQFNAAAALATSPYAPQLSSAQPQVQAAVTPAAPVAQVPPAPTLAPAPTPTPAPAPSVPPQPTAARGTGRVRGLEPTPIQDMGQQEQKTV